MNANKTNRNGTATVRRGPLGFTEIERTATGVSVCVTNGIVFRLVVDDPQKLCSPETTLTVQNMEIFDEITNIATRSKELVESIMPSLISPEICGERSTAKIHAHDLTNDGNVAPSLALGTHKPSTELTALKAADVAVAEQNKTTKATDEEQIENIRRKNEQFEDGRNLALVAKTSDGIVTPHGIPGNAYSAKTSNQAELSIVQQSGLSIKPLFEPGRGLYTDSNDMVSKQSLCFCSVTSLDISPAASAGM